MCSVIINLGTCDINNNRINLRSMVSSFYPPPHPTPSQWWETQQKIERTLLKSVLFCWLGFNLFWPKLNKKGRYCKVPKISPGAYIFQRPFLRGLSTEGNWRFQIDWASLIVGSKFTIFTVFVLFYFVFEGNFPSTSPWEAYMWRGDLTEG